MGPGNWCPARAPDLGSARATAWAQPSSRSSRDVAERGEEVIAALRQQNPAVCARLASDILLRECVSTRVWLAPARASPPPRRLFSRTTERAQADHVQEERHVTGVTRPPGRVDADPLAKPGSDFTALVSGPPRRRPPRIDHVVRDRPRTQLVSALRALAPAR